MSKPKVAIYWAASCGGCDTKILDTDEKLLDIAAAVDIVFWPIAMDFKYADLEKFADREIDLTIINGAVRNSEQEHIVKLLRQKSKVVAALGACAVSGGIPGLANQFTADEMLDYIYRKTLTTEPNSQPPKTETETEDGVLTLPRFYNTVFSLPQVIDVEYFIPGCPPPPSLIVKALELFVAGELPPPPAFVTGDKSVCDECPRERTGKFEVKQWKRLATHQPEQSDRCLLEQGFLCLGPATPSGCGALCPKANMPCEGCMGKSQDVVDRGAKFISTIASLYPAKTEEEIKKMLDEIPDLVGTLYRFDLPSSVLRGKAKKS